MKNISMFVFSGPQLDKQIKLKPMIKCWNIPSVEQNITLCKYNNINVSQCKINYPKCEIDDLMDLYKNNLPNVAFNQWVLLFLVF